MGKAKRKKKRKVSTAEYAGRLARGGLASLELINRYEAQVLADPLQAEQHGCTREQMLAGLQVLRAELVGEIVNTSLVAAGV